MNLEEFLVAFRDSTKKINYSLDGCLIRSSGVYGRFCPLTGVFFCKTGRNLPSMLFRKASNEMGMDSELANKLATVSDGFKTTIDGQKSPWWDESLRQQLLEIIK